MQIKLEIVGDPTQDTALARVLAVLAGDYPSRGSDMVQNIQMDGVVSLDQAMKNLDRNGTLPPMPAPIAAQVQGEPLPTGDDDEDDDPNTAPPATDSAGLPWDERIHAATKTTKADGTWKRRKGVSADEAAPIEAELRGAAQPAPMPMPAAEAPPVPVIPPMPVAQPEPTAPVVPMVETLTFTEFMARLGPIMSAGKADMAYLQAVAAEMGLSSITDLNAKPELIGQAISLFVRDGRWL